MVVRAGSRTGRRAAVSCGTHVQCSLNSGRNNALACKSWHTATSMHSPWLQPHTLRSSSPSSIWCLKGPRSTVRIRSLFT